MSFKYEEILDANRPNWIAELKGFLDKGKQVAVVNIPMSAMRDCIAFAQEHDFTCIVEDKELELGNYPQEQPKILGFVHRNPSNRISN
jgi:hypothetical protein